MGIFKRVKDLVSSNVNSILDKAEDPSKMVEQTLRDAKSELSQVNTQTASLMAKERALGSEIEELQASINKLQVYAQKAVDSGNDDDARKFLKQKSDVMTKMADKKSLHSKMVADVESVKSLQRSLNNKVAEMENRKEVIKAKADYAKTQSSVNKLTSSVDGSSLSKFDEYEKKIDLQLGTELALNELSKDPNDVSSLMDKYDVGEISIEDELASLKSNKDLEV